jgi:hypothetical protein
LLDELCELSGYGRKHAIKLLGGKLSVVGEKAVLTYIVRLAWFGDGLTLLNAAVVVGLLDALTPIAILFGAIFFFVAMEKSGATGVLQDWLESVSPNPIARIMLAGWSFIGPGRKEISAGALPVSRYERWDLRPVCRQFGRGLGVDWRRRISAESGGMVGNN